MKVLFSLVLPFDVAVVTGEMVFKGGAGKLILFTTEVFVESDDCRQWERWLNDCGGPVVAAARLK